jgi:hypothetical protein
VRGRSLHYGRVSTRSEDLNTWSESKTGDTVPSRISFPYNHFRRCMGENGKKGFTME